MAALRNMRHRVLLDAAGENVDEGGVVPPVIPEAVGHAEVNDGVITSAEPSAQMSSSTVTYHTAAAPTAAPSTVTSDHPAPSMFSKDPTRSRGYHPPRPQLRQI